MSSNKGSDMAPALHPAWNAFMRYCAELKYGQVERLSIQDRLPVLAETTTKKINFNNP